MRRILEELKRRRIISVVTWYVLAVWVLLQVADVLGPVLTGGDEALRFVVWLAVLGFPLALFLGWRYDFSGGHIQRTLPAEDAERTPLGPRDFVLLGVAGAAAVALGLFAVRQAGEAPVVEAIGAPNSVAVLKLEDHTGRLAPLADELSDQLVTTLIANRNLSVSGRASSFYFADRSESLARVAEVLESRHLLTGRLQGDPAAPTLRLELVTLPGETVAWADNLAVDPQRPWQVYGPAAEQVAMAIGVVSPGDVATARNNDELENLLRLARDSELDTRRALLTQAAALAPEDPRPWVELSFLEQDQLMINDKDRDDAMAASRAALDRATELGADDYRYHWGMGRHLRRLMRFQGVTPEREQAFVDHMERAITLNPSDAVPFLTYSIHHRLQRRYDQAGDLIRRSLERDPLYAGARMQYSRILSAQGQREEAFRWVLQIPPLFGRYWDDVADRYLEFNEFDHAAWWFRRNPEGRAGTRLRLARTWTRMQAIDEARAVLTELAGEPRVGEVARLFLDRLDRNDDPRAQLDVALARVNPDLPDERQLTEIEGVIWAAAMAGEDRLVVEMIERREPGLADPLAPEVTEANAETALTLAMALRRLGAQESRESVLAGQVLTLGRNRPVLGFDGIGDRDIRVHAYRGESERALDLLEAAVEEGFRDLYPHWGGLHPAYEPLAGAPRFLALKARIDEDLAAMRERARTWIREGVDLMGPPPKKLASLDPGPPAP